MPDSKHNFGNRGKITRDELSKARKSLDRLAKFKNLGKKQSLQADDMSNDVSIAFDPDMGQPLLLSMRDIAGQWSERARARSFKPSDLAILKPGPEMLASEANELACKIHRHDGAIKNIPSEKLPAILELANGMTARLTELLPEGQCRFAYKGRCWTVPISALSIVYAGSYFLLEPEYEQVNKAMSRAQHTGAQFSSPTQTLGPKEASNNRITQLQGLLGWLVNGIWQRNRSLLLQLIAAAGLSNLLMITLPLFIMTVYDRVIPHQATETLWTLSIGIMIALALDLALRYVRLTLLDAIGLSASVKLQSSLYQRLTRMSLSQIPRSPGGLTDALREIENLCLTGPALIVAILVDLPFILIILALIAYIGSSIVWGAIIGAAAIALMIGYSFHLSRTKGQQDAQLSHQKTNTMSETIGALEAVKATGAENQLLSSWERLTDISAVTSHKARLQNSFSMQATMVASQLAIVLTVMIGVFRIGDGLMTVGNLAAAILLVGRVIGPVSNIVSVTVRSVTLSETLYRVQSMMEAPQEAASDLHRRSVVSATPKLAFKDVSYGFANAKHPCLKDISLTFAPGEKVGIIGRNGSGKSSLLKLIPRFYEPTEGAILLDDFNIQQYDPRNIREHVAYMPQDNILFDTSIRENITLGQAELDQRHLDQISRMTGVADFVANHPEGFGRAVGPRGDYLSGGEKQAVCLARTLAGQAGVFILDEPTSAMDNSTEASFVKNAQSFFADKTLILSTHRLHLLNLVDRVIWLDNGKIVADGPKENVLATLRKTA